MAWQCPSRASSGRAGRGCACVTRPWLVASGEGGSRAAPTKIEQLNRGGTRLSAGHRASGPPLPQGSEAADPLHTAAQATRRLPAHRESPERAQPSLVGAWGHPPTPFPLRFPPGEAGGPPDWGRAHGRAPLRIRNRNCSLIRLMGAWTSPTRRRRLGSRGWPLRRR